MRKHLLAVASLFWIGGAIAQNTPLWMRYPAISPDGKTIVFGYKAICIVLLLPAELLCL
jgi:tricorn protease